MTKSSINQRLKNIRISSIFIIVVILDLVSTYIGSPDLKHESSFLVQKVDFGWTEILIFFILYTSLIVYLFINSSRISQENRRLTNVTFKQASSIALKETILINHFKSINLKNLIAIIGYVTIRTAIYFHGIAILNNVTYVIFLNKNYVNNYVYRISEYYYAFDTFFYQQFTLSYDIIFGLPIIIFIFINFFRVYAISLFGIHDINELTSRH